MRSSVAFRRPARQSLTTLRLLLVSLLLGACDHSTLPPADPVWKCAIATDSAPSFSPTLGCAEDFEALAYHPLDASIPGVLSVKTVIDRADSGHLYFIDTRKFRLHYDFASERLSGNGKPLVRSISEFGLTEYYTPHRRFILGSLSRYRSSQGSPGIWVWEMTPSDNASAAMMALAYRTIAEACFCGKQLYFHATSLAIEEEAKKLPASVKVLTTSKVHEGVDYQALNHATGVGKVVFTTAAELNKDPSGHQGILILDAMPDALPTAGGIITQAFQNPLSRPNAMARNHGIPNMGLRGALTDSALRALEGKWAKLVVGPFGYSVSAIGEEEAEAWRKEHPVAAPTLPVPDTTVQDVRDVREILDLKSAAPAEAMQRAFSAYGARTAHLSAFARMDTSKVRHEKSLGIPFHYYSQHMRKSGLEDSVIRMLADPAFKSDAAERERRLKALREAILAAPLDSTFLRRLEEALDAGFPGVGSFRLLSSSNAEGLEGYAGAGLYGSRVGNRAGPSLRQALLGIWAELWDFRAFEDRFRSGIVDRPVAMGVLVREARTGEEANGVALTANPYDAAGMEPGFYVIARSGEAPATGPDASGASDQFLYHHGITGQPIVLLARADRSPAETPVLTPAQTFALGNALQEVHRFFMPVYAHNPSGWYAMQVEFKLDQAPGDPPGAAPVILLQQAEPFRGLAIP